MNATVSTTTAATARTARIAALGDALAELSFKDGSAIVALSVPQAVTLATISMTGKAKTVQHASADALYRLALVDADITKPGVYTLTAKGIALVKKAARIVKATPLRTIVVEVAPAAKAKIAKASKELGAKHFSHTDCAHEKTPAARAACRKAHAKA